jgi:tetratricopeptide (TPR) repeat protein
MEMRPLPIFVVAIFLSAAAGAGAALVVTPRSQSQASPSAATDDAARVDKTLAQLEGKQAELQRGLDDLKALLGSGPSSRNEVGDLDAAVARWMKEHSSGAAAPASDSMAAASTKTKEQRIASAIAQLSDPQISDVERRQLWSQFAKEGLIDDLLAAFENRAERDPNNVDAQVELGVAYLEKLFNSPTGPESGVWATKADKTFDAALALDPQRWDARFTKAVALSNWPAFLGKQSLAIQQFETLVEQQSHQPKEPHFAQTHLFLGNMYLQMGQKDKAMATWQSGLAQYPDNHELQAQIDLNSGH